jgi:hypothetical protein
MLAASVAKCRDKPVRLGGLPFGWFSAFVVICAGFGVGAKFHEFGSCGRVTIPVQTLGVRAWAGAVKLQQLGLPGVLCGRLALPWCHVRETQ